MSRNVKYLKSIPYPVTDPDLDFIAPAPDPRIESVEINKYSSYHNSCAYIGMATTY